ncbi:MAG: Gfo/Idh/MocA family oxidoreductase [Armatimonadetes bacterium]|nr:Gfo/Idh/MocA family oxidoreductase [Armatimonadota bacterium]
MSQKIYRVGVAGMVHDHVWGELRHWKDLPNAQVVAAADPNEPLREQIRSQYGVTSLYASWQEMIDKEKLDIIQAAAENGRTAEIVEAAAPKGLHVISEKPMAARLSQANRMVEAAKKAGTQLMVNWPTAWSPAIQTMARLIREGAVGDLFYFKYRAAHNGPKEIGCSEYFWKWLYDEELNGAGAYMDYCCYAADLCAYFMGLPRSVFGFRGIFVKDYSIPDDNAMVVMKYDKGFGVAEACWTQKVGYAMPNPVAYGTEGAVAIDHGAVVLHRPGKEGEKIDPAPLPEGQRSGPEYLVSCLEAGKEVEGMCSARVSRDAQEILEAGLLSADTGKAVAIPVVM